MTASQLASREESRRLSWLCLQGRVSSWRGELQWGGHVLVHTREAQVGSRKSPQSRWPVPLPLERRSTRAAVVQSMAAAPLPSGSGKTSIRECGPLAKSSSLHLEAQPGLGGKHAMLEKTGKKGPFGNKNHQQGI